MKAPSSAAQRPSDIGRPRSGQHAGKVVKFVISEDARDLLDQAANAETRSDWMRAKLALAVAHELKLDPTETLELFTTDA
jgi:hypothetical protein